MRYITMSKYQMSHRIPECHRIKHENIFGCHLGFINRFSFSLRFNNIHATEEIEDSEKIVDSLHYQNIFDIPLSQIRTGGTLFQQEGGGSHRSSSTLQYLIQQAVS